mgnify:CR=1 FL=1
MKNLNVQFSPQALSYMDLDDPMSASSCIAGELVALAASMWYHPAAQGRDDLHSVKVTYSPGTFGGPDPGHRFHLVLWDHHGRAMAARILEVQIDEDENLHISSGFAPEGYPTNESLH